MTTFRAGRRWRRFGRDAEGFALVEFAMALPVMLVAYAGTVEIAQMVMANRKVTQLRLALADLTARAPAVAPADIENIFDASQAIMLPFGPPENVSMVISSVVIDANRVAKVCWSSQRRGTALARGTTVTLPDSVRVASTSVIMAQASYRYTPTLGTLLPGVFKLDNNGSFTLGNDPIYTRPRSGQALGTASIEQIVRTGTNPCPNFT